MKSQVIFVLVLSCFHFQSVVCSVGFESFVRAKIVEYPEWIRANNLDPSPPMSSGFNLETAGLIAQLNTSISDMVVQGLDAFYEITGLDTNLGAGSFRVNLYSWTKIVLSGSHKTSGTILTSPVNAEGQWNISLEYYYVNFDMEFEIGPSGFLNLTKADLYVYLYTPTEVNFDGVTNHDAAQGYEQYVREAIYEQIQQYMLYTYDKEEFDPIRSTYIRYWKEVLAETTLADIIGATDAPSTVYTSTTYRSTPSSTPTPNPCAGDKYTDKATYFEEKVLETREGVDSDGTPITMTKMVVVKKQRHEL